MRNVMPIIEKKKLRPLKGFSLSGGGDKVGRKKNVKKFFYDYMLSDIDSWRFLDQEAAKGRAWGLQLYKEIGKGNRSQFVQCLEQ
jgi:hypothetical protein